ncbi:MAG: hypothetical protein DCC69_06090 [Hyphomicrobiales bacterium]|nr:MAG: hypothetical protein DCC69_06090 [Hyphomicrobiales bacterium]
MKQGPRRSDRAAGALAGSLMLAPAVMALRAPLLAAEAGGLDPWRLETTRAATEGMVAAQLSLARSASVFWLELASGATPSLLNGVALERAFHAALKPAGRRVKRNYKRLKRGK